MTQGPYKDHKPNSPETRKVHPLNFSAPHGNHVAEYRMHLAKTNKMHPDGKAWTKCCCGDKDLTLGSAIDCAFTAGRLSRADTTTDVPFICVHRSEDGFLRVCAGWDACHAAAYAAIKAKS